MINSQYKLLVVDVDGTLIDKKGAISAEDRKVLAKASDSGMQVSLCTGRVPGACVHIINQLSLDGYHIFSDGALVSNPEDGKEIYVQLLNQTVVKQAIEFAHLNDIDLDLYSATHYFAERETWSVVAHRQYFNIAPEIVDFSNIWSRERIIKIGMAATTAQEKDKIIDFSFHFKDSLHFSWATSPGYPEVDFINVVAPGISKAKALEALVSHLGVSLGEVIAIGDGINDISLLSKAGLAVAMGDAPDEVKAVADYVTLDVAQSGIAAAINKFLL